jgi:hypothetical protein
MERLIQNLKEYMLNPGRIGERLKKNLPRGLKNPLGTPLSSV